MTSRFRTCTMCQAEKPLSDFGQRGERDGTPLYKSRCKACEAERAREWYYNNKERGDANSRRSRLNARFGITPEEYERLLADQGGVCAICANPERTERDGKPMRLSVDHCHTTGKVRGLLCHGCNRSIGLFGEDVDLMEKAAQYLERHRDA